MSYRLSADDEAMCEAVRSFAARELAPAAQEIDETAAFIAPHLPQLAALGIMGMNLPPDWGGPGMSAPALLAAVEAIAGACAATASVVTAHFLATDSVLLGGDDDLRRRVLPGAAAGRTLGAFALTEPRAGSNPADMRTQWRAYQGADARHYA